MNDFLSTLLTAGVLSAVISGLISFRQQTRFFKEQEKHYKEKENNDEKKKIRFIVSAFLLEANYNYKLTEQAEKGSLMPSFDTQCYSLFKQDIALLAKETTDKICELYIQIFEINRTIQKVQDSGGKAQGYYILLRIPILEFIGFLNAKYSLNQ